MELETAKINVLSEVASFADRCHTQLIKQGWEEKAVHNVRTALVEALANAIRHGNEGNETKIVVILFLITTEACSFEITDEGDGFDPDSVPDPTAPQNLEKPTGRGVFMMKHYMDEVTFNEKGNTVWLKKKKP